MTYFDYKFLHIFLSLSYLFILVSSCYSTSNKFLRLSLGIITTLVFVSGVAVMTRLSIPIKGPYPSWIIAKIILWIILAVAPPVIIKRFPKFSKPTAYLMFLIVSCMAFLGVYKI